MLQGGTNTTPKETPVWDLGYNRLLVSECKSYSPNYDGCLVKLEDA